VNWLDLSRPDPQLSVPDYLREGRNKVEVRGYVRKAVLRQVYKANKGFSNLIRFSKLR
jgi:hypothetical protein